MPRSFLLVCLLGLLLAAAALGAGLVHPVPQAQGPQAQGPQARALFDGRTLAGWEGDGRHWSVEDGCLVGRTTAEAPLERTTFLVWTGGELRDFELTLAYQLVAGNSGVQFRSRVAGEHNVAGYQVDLADGQGISGSLYEQFGRGTLVARGHRTHVAKSGKALSERVAEESDIAAALRPGEWAELRIRAEGARSEIWINGVRTAELLDESPLRASLSGCLALQLHSGPPMEVRFRDIRLSELGGVHDGRPRFEPLWIWSHRDAEPEEEAWFQHGFELSGAPRRAILYAVADDGFEAYLNGELVAAGEGTERTQQIDVTEALSAGPNVLALWAHNFDGPAGLLALLQIELEGETRPLLLGSDSTWRAARTEPEGWLSDEDAAAWGTPHAIGPIGTEPWGRPANHVKNAPLAALAGEDIVVPEGFVAERLYSVPRARQGSWVALCFDDSGRAYASDQHGSLYRIEFGTTPLSPRVERVDLPIGEAQGMCWAFDALYVVVNHARRYQSGLYRLTDSDGDEHLDEVELLRAFEGEDEHGPHAVIHVPAEDALFVVGGHEVAPPAEALAEWGPSFLPVGRLPVAVQSVEMTEFELAKKGYSGWVARTDREGNEWELVAIGLRNAYDLALFDDGLYAFDSDMEWDLGLPWYVPTRLLRLQERADYGFRLGSARWPLWFPDSLAGVLDTGRSSPTGMLSAEELEFPESFRHTLLAGDWLQGRILAFHPARGDAPMRMEVFASGKPLPVTDLARGPDGALYLVTGGRHTQSGLYRIRSVQEAAAHRKGSYQRLSDTFEHTRKHLEKSLQGLAGDSPTFRNTVRGALESSPLEEWVDRVASEPDAHLRGQLELALARVGPPGRVGELLERLATRPIDTREREPTLVALRTLELALLRAEPVEPTTRASLSATLLEAFPTNDVEMDRQLGVLLASLPEAAEAFVPLAVERLRRSTGAEAFHWAFVLRGVEGGWTSSSRRQYFMWLASADASFLGGRAVPVYLEALREDALAWLDAEAREDLGGLAEPGVDAGWSTPNLRPFVRAWTLAELEPMLGRLDEARDPVRGQALLRGASCFDCHRIEGRGQALGPELDGLAGRFSALDLLEAIVEPSREVPDRFRDTLITTEDERLHVGRIVGGDEASILLRESYGRQGVVRIARDEVAEQELSRLSPMPEGLLDTLDLEEILDLMAYLLQDG